MAKKLKADTRRRISYTQQVDKLRAFDARLEGGGNIGDHEPCSQNHSGLYVRLGGHSLLCGRLCVYCFIRAYWQELIAMRHTFFVFRLIGLKVLSFHVPEPYYIVLAY